MVRLGQVTLVIGLLVIILTMAFVSIFPNIGGMLIFGPVLLFGALCVMYSMVENTEIPK